MVPRSRRVFEFHQPDTLAEWLLGKANEVRDSAVPTFLSRVRSISPLVTGWGEFKLWPAQITAIRNLEASLAQNKPRALIQMATGSGKMWIYDLRTNNHFTLETSPMRREDLDEFVALYNPVNRHDREATWSESTPDRRFRCYEYNELIARDKASLDVFWLRDETLADSDNLPPPEVIAQEIVDDLEAALEQFRLIAADLGNGAAQTDS